MKRYRTAEEPPGRARAERTITETAIVIDHSVSETLLHVRKLMLDLERHLDQAADGGDLTDIGRAWVRSEQVERALRAVVPPDVMDIAKAKEGTDEWHAGRSGTTP